MRIVKKDSKEKDPLKFKNWEYIRQGRYKGVKVVNDLVQFDNDMFKSGIKLGLACQVVSPYAKRLSLYAYEEFTTFSNNTGLKLDITP